MEISKTLETIKKYDGTGLYSDDTKVWLDRADIVEYQYWVVGTETISEPVLMSVGNWLSNKGFHATSRGTIHNHAHFHGYPIESNKTRTAAFVTVAS